MVCFLDQGSNRSGKQVYLGSYADAESAAREFDKACIKLHECKGGNPNVNFQALVYDMQPYIGLNFFEYVDEIRKSRKRMQSQETLLYNTAGVEDTPVFLRHDASYISQSTD